MGMAAMFALCNGNAFQSFKLLLVTMPVWIQKEKNKNTNKHAISLCLKHGPLFNNEILIKGFKTLIPDICFF